MYRQHVVVPSRRHNHAKGVGVEKVSPADDRQEKLLECQSSMVLDPGDPSFRALSGRLTFAVRRHNFNKNSLSHTTQCLRTGPK